MSAQEPRTLAGDLQEVRKAAYAVLVAAWEAIRQDADVIVSALLIGLPLAFLLAVWFDPNSFK